MSNIKAPFNFVPLNEKVFYPDWVDQISQDIPFADELSGSFTLNIEAHSPIFVRNGNLEGKDIPLDQRDNSFSNHNGNYFIPGTSIKGMLRSVLEILSFSKLGIYNDDRYAVRDLSKADNFYMSKMKPQNIRCGWLFKDGESFKIIDCDLPMRVSHYEIDEKYETSMASYFRGEKISINNNEYTYTGDDDFQKSAKHKYELFSKAGLKKNTFSFFKDYGGRKIYKIDENGEKEGTIVFTGQPGKRTIKDGKIYEFAFGEPISEQPIKLSQKVVEDFKSAYFAHDEKKQSEDWEYWWKKLLEGKKVPVFFQKSGRDIVHLGFSYLYKLPYTYKVSDYLDYQNYDEADLAECIFGAINKNKEDMTLKGRVHIGHAFCDRIIESNNICETILSSPKASYYPIYIRQKIVDKKSKKVSEYHTYMNGNKDTEIAGRKRYPIHKNFKAGLNEPEEGQEKVTVKFTPLDKGSNFKCIVYYHNLKKIELGALFSAITFHNTDGCFHSLGMAKPLGYGKVKITLDNIQGVDKLDCMKAFEAQMNHFLKMNWINRSELRELVTMASVQDKDETNLRYMSLSDNEFSKAKNAEEGFDLYSNLASNLVNIKSLLSTSDNYAPINVLELESKLLEMDAKYSTLLAEYISEKEALLKKEEKEEKVQVIQNQGLVLEIEDDVENVFKQVKKYLSVLKLSKVPPKDYTSLRFGLQKCFNSVNREMNKNKYKNWGKELPKLLKKYLDDEALINEWLKDILGQ